MEEEGKTEEVKGKRGGRGEREREREKLKANECNASKSGIFLEPVFCSYLLLFFFYFLPHFFILFKGRGVSG